MGLGGLGVLKALNPIEVSHAQETTSTATAQHNIIFRTLGKTGIRVPIVSMGVMNLRDAKVIAESYKLGVRHFDTAWYYGRGWNEKTLGTVIKDLGARDDVVIGTKIYLKDVTRTRKLSSEEQKELFLKRFDESLQRLQTDYVDILYLHSVEQLDQMQDPGILEAFAQLKAQKKIRFAGISTHVNPADCLQALLKTDAWDVLLIAFNYAMAADKNVRERFLQFKPLLQQIADKGIGIIAMKTQAGGYWTRRSVTERAPDPSLNQTAMLKWVLRHEFMTTAIPGYTTFDQMHEDFSVAYGLDYTPEEEQFFAEQNPLYASGFCHQCRQCLETCPKKVNIPTLMRTYMYAYQYQNLEHAFATYQEIAPKRNMTQCRSCSVCSAWCVNSLPIARRLDGLKDLNLV
jgi:predicted aldo/keto reductase-like oxidoreductase